MARGLTNAEISKTLEVCESPVRYFRQRPKILEVKKAREMSAELIAIKINNKFTLASSSILTSFFSRGFDYVSLLELLRLFSCLKVSLSFYYLQLLNF